MHPNTERQLDASWREAIRLVFQQRVFAMASEFPGDRDQFLKPKERRIRDSATGFIARTTGTEPEYVLNALIEAAHNYLIAKPSEADPAWLSPPEWTAFVVGWEQRTEIVVPQADLGAGL